VSAKAVALTIVFRQSWQGEHAAAHARTLATTSRSKLETIDNQPCRGHGKNVLWSGNASLNQQEGDVGPCQGALARQATLMDCGTWRARTIAGHWDSRR
jgi:hypothetical protein